MQYTVRNIPADLDRELRRRARRDGKSLNQVTVEALLAGAGLGETPSPQRDLGDIVGTWVHDPDVEAALEDQRRIDPDLWS